ncbi:NUDIX hydrolase [Catenovulum sp. 2E275]|uniref:NUDIX hydrolase n=1 Tax=Catenovulum sp. 2E275 TaxID=2980497 RepID=UPI0021D158FF|nr:NUDIX hydrolase [Catenovulum sp. 2E275]MCU4677705.1 NUDIX hydrolase [Catenovulum sp. 2E275]
MNPWIDWVKQIQAIAQAGKTYGKDQYDQQRYAQLAEISQQMYAHLSSAPIEQVKQIFIPETGYPTPKIDLRAAVIKNDKILLVKEREDNGWTMPGGWADVCETASNGVVREVLEESGYIVEKPRLIRIKDRAIHDYQPEYPFHIYKFFFLCELTGGEAKTNIEVSEIDFFGIDEIPPLSSGRTSKADIQMAFDHFYRPQQSVLVD